MQVGFWLRFFGASPAKLRFIGASPAKLRFFGASRAKLRFLAPPLPSYVFGASRLWPAMAGDRPGYRAAIERL